ncbi:MAG TPA: hypothetical protein VFE25_15110 [Opitutaceae bacterium]|jgi:hypothetical protein|nr:hypothetical protein [Opitutaceae bacterium]
MMHLRFTLSRLARAAFLAAFVALSANLGSAAEPVLKVTSLEGSISFTQAEFRLLPHVTIKAFNAHEKSEHEYSGVPVHDLLAKAGAPLGERLRGPALRLAVIAKALDGYATLYSLAEFDESFSDRVILLVDSEDGKPLGEGAGPFRIVAPGDKRPARWARMVKSLEIVQFSEAPASK